MNMVWKILELFLVFYFIGDTAWHLMTPLRRPKKRGDD